MKMHLFIIIMTAVIGVCLGLVAGQDELEINTAIDAAIADCYDMDAGDFTFDKPGCEKVRQLIIVRAGK